MSNTNNNRINKANFFDDEFHLREIFDVLWKKKVFIIIFTSFFATGSVFYSLSLTNYYKSEALLSVDRESNNNAMGMLGGMASSLGILSPSSNEKSVIAIKTIESRSFLKHLLTFDNILPSLMAAKSYDEQSQNIQFDPGIYNKDSGDWVGPKPSYLEIYPFYMEQVLISHDYEHNLLSVSVEHISPVFAKEFLELIINEANELLRAKDLRESTDAIEFLQSELTKASLITMKDALNQLVQSQLEVQMLAKINPEYILKVIEPAYIPEEKTKPNRAKICILGTFLGGMLSILWILLNQNIIGHSSRDMDP